MIKIATVQAVNGSSINLEDTLNETVDKLGIDFDDIISITGGTFNNLKIFYRANEEDHGFCGTTPEDDLVIVTRHLMEKIVSAVDEFNRFGVRWNGLGDVEKNMYDLSLAHETAKKWFDEHFIER